AAENVNKQIRLIYRTAVSHDLTFRKSVSRNFPVTNLILVLTILISVGGNRSVVLCMDSNSDHVEYERVSDLRCSVKSSASNSDDKSDHFNKLQNRLAEVDPCTDILIELSEFHIDSKPLFPSLLISSATVVHSDFVESPCQHCQKTACMLLPTCKTPDSLTNTTVLLI
ncbi:hypothetical protein KQI52_08765, partial [bacterium]|nr:hypothetical protein [bacterium]